MPKLPKDLKVTKNEVSQRFNASEILGVDVSKRPRLVQEVGQALLDKMVDRTESGKDYFGKDFKKYSKRYIESDDFKDADKSAREVNMTLTGDMIDSTDFTSRGDKIKISVGDGVDTKKAYNHCVGDTLPQRRWFGLSKKDQMEIRKEFKEEIREIKRQEVEESRLRQEETALDLAENVTINFGSVSAPTQEAVFIDAFFGDDDE